MNGMLHSEDSVHFVAYLQHDKSKFMHSLNGHSARGYSQNDTVYNSVKYTSC